RGETIPKKPEGLTPLEIPETPSTLFPLVQNFEEATSLTVQETKLAEENAENKLSGSIGETLESGYKKASNFLKRAMTFGLAGNERDVETYTEKTRRKAFENLIKNKTVPSEENIQNEIKRIAYKEELDKIKNVKVNNYLSSISDKERQDLNVEKIIQARSIDSDIKTKFIEAEIESKQVGEIVKRRDSIIQRIEEIEKEAVSAQEKGNQLSSEIISEYENLFEEVNSLEDKRLNIVDKWINVDKEIEEKYKSLNDANEAIDLFKRQYGFWDNMKGIAASNAARALEGGYGFLALTSEFSTVPNPVGSIYFTKKAREVAKDIETVEGQLRRKMEYNEINNISDLGYFVAQETATQIPIVAQMAIPFVGVASIGATSSGRKFSEMKEQNI